MAATLFQFADPFLFRPLPYPASERLIAITVRSMPGAARELRAATPTVEALSTRGDLFAHVAAYQQGDVERFEVGGSFMAVRTTRVTQGFFAILGRPAPASWRPSVGVDSERQLVLTERVLTQQLPGTATASVLGRAFPTASGTTVRIADVLPHEFLFPSANVTFPPQALVPAEAREFPIVAAERVLARLADSVSAEDVGHALRVWLGPQYRVSVQPLRDHIAQRTRPVAWGALVAAFVIMITGAASVTTLSLSAMVAKSSGWAVRAALGASRVDIYRLATFESLGLVGIAALFGLIATAATTTVLARLAPAEYLVLGAPGFSIRTLTVAVGGGLSMAALSALALAVFGPRWSPRRLRYTPGDAARTFRPAGLLALVFQSMLATTLLMAAAWLGKSYLVLAGLPTGFHHDSVLVTTSYDPSTGGAALQADIDTTLQQLEHLPGVSAAAATIGSMLDRLTFPGSVAVGGESVPTTSKRVTDRYLDAVGGSLIEGRFFGPTDGPSNEVVITEGLARQLVPHGSAVGLPLSGGRSVIIGVIADERNLALDAAPAATILSRMYEPWSGCRTAPCGQITYVLRSPVGDTRELAQRAANTIRTVRPSAVVVEQGSIGERLAGGIATRTFSAAVLAVSSIAAVILAAAGVFAVVAFVARTRRREIAVRMALGASRQSVLALLAQSTTIAVVVGALCGLTLSWTSSHGLQHLVFGTTTSAASTAIEVVGLILAVTATATLAGAWSTLTLPLTTAMNEEV